MNHNKTGAVGLSLLLTLLVSTAHSHGVPINVYVQSTTGQLAVFDGYEPGELESLGESDIFTDTPGIGISSTVNGFDLGETLLLNVIQGLLYWDGTTVVPTEETLTIDWPDSGGTSSVEYYTVTAQASYQTGLTWGVYQPAGGNGSWDAHGEFALASANSAAGIYGLVLQLDSPSNIASEPFLLPLIYDPAATLGAAAVTTGIENLQQAMLPLPTADFDRNTTVDAIDLIHWQTNYASPLAVSQVQGDATQNGTVNGADFLAWQRQYTAPATSTLSNTLSNTSTNNPTATLQAIPEPTSFCLVLLASSLFFTLRNSTRTHTMNKILTVLTIFLACLTVAPESQAAITTTEFRADLNAAVVQPQKPAHANSTATASALFTLAQDDTDPAATTLRYEIQFHGLDIAPTDSQNLLDDITAVHFHDTTVCANASLCGDGSGGQLLGSTAGTRHVLNVLGVPRQDDADLQVFAAADRLTGRWDSSDATPGMMMAPSQSITDPAILELLFNGKLAVMVHTNRIPSGEIGGFVQQVPEPTTLLLTCLAISTLLTRRPSRFSSLITNAPPTKHPYHQTPSPSPSPSRRARFSGRQVQAIPQQWAAHKWPSPARSFMNAFQLETFQICRLQSCCR